MLVSSKHYLGIAFYHFKKLFLDKIKNTIKHQTLVVNLFNHNWQGLSVSTHQTIKEYFYFSL